MLFFSLWVAFICLAIIAIPVAATLDKRKLRAELAAAEAEANRTKEESRRVIEAERESARSQLKGQVDQLSNKIIDRLLAA